MFKKVIKNWDLGDILFGFAGVVLVVYCIGCAILCLA